MVFYYVDVKHCPICEEGHVGFQLCDDHKQIVLRCDECDAIWLSPASYKSGQGKTMLVARPPHFLVPNTHCSLKNIRWATEEEIERYGWKEYIVGSGTPLGGD